MEIKFTIQQIIVVKEKVSTGLECLFRMQLIGVSHLLWICFFFYDSVILLCNKRGTVQKDEWILIIQADFLFFFYFKYYTHFKRCQIR